MDKLLGRKKQLRRAKKAEIRLRDDAVLTDPELMSMTLPDHKLINVEKLSEAVAVFEALCVEDSDNVYAHKVLAYLYVETGQFESALAVISKLGRIRTIDNKSLVAAYFLEGRAYLGLDQKLEAMRCFEAHRLKLSQL
ncbi:MAG: hypothetical protein AB8B64_02465 [Granulosicoccus sp.]